VLKILGQKFKSIVKREEHIHEQKLLNLIISQYIQNFLNSSMESPNRPEDSVKT